MAIESIAGAPLGVIGFRAVGTVTANDYRDVLHPAIQAAIDAGTPVNVVFVVGADFEHYSLGALWQDAKVEKYPHDSWGRMALVTDHRGFAEAAHLLRFAFPGELAIFPTTGEADALAWAATFAA